MSGYTARCAEAENSIGIEFCTYAAGARSALVRVVSDRRRRCAKGSDAGVWDWREELSTGTMKAGGSGGGAKGEVKTPKPARSCVGDEKWIIEAGLLAFKSSVSTSAFVKLDLLLVWSYTDVPFPGTSFSVAAQSSDDLREAGGVGSGLEG